MQKPHARLLNLVRNPRPPRCPQVDATSAVRRLKRQDLNRREDLAAAIQGAEERVRAFQAVKAQVAGAASRAVLWYVLLDKRI